MRSVGACSQAGLRLSPAPDQVIADVIPASAGSLCPAGGYVPRPDRSASDSLAPKTETVPAPGKLQTMAEHPHYGRGTWFGGIRRCFHRFDQILKPNGRGIGARYGGTAHQRVRYASQA